MTNEQLWNSVFKFIEESDENNGEIKNKDGRIGIIDIHEKGLIIRWDNQEIIYLSDEPITNIINDGWIIE
jgi:hypothetical protein